MLDHRLAFLAVLLATTSAFGQDDDDEQPPGLFAKYQANQSVVERVDPDISFDWSGAAPDERLPSGKFTASWSGTLLLRSADKYRFHAFVQGRVTLKVNGRAVLEGEADQPQWLSGNETALTFGEQPFELSFVRTGDAAQLKLFWSSNDFPLEPVPYHSLFQTKASPELTLIERGRVQFDAYRCGNCHAAPGRLMNEDERLAAPSLKHVGAGTRRDWLLEKLMQRSGNAPAPANATGKMPHFGFAREEAEAIVAALLSKSVPIELTATAKLKESERAKDLQAGGTLVRSVGCLACHTWNSLGETTPFGGGSLDELMTRRSTDWLTTWLSDPARLNPRHRMPVFTLTDKERSQIVLALSAATAPSTTTSMPNAAVEKPAPVDEAVLARGIKLMEAARCALCHELPGPKSNSQPVLSLIEAKIDWDRGCTLPPDRAKHRPGFPQADAQALRTFVASWQRGGDQIEPAVRDASTSGTLAGRRVLERKNCLGCHDRDDVRGISRHAAAIAKADESLAGLHMTLIPPRLNAVGDRLHDAGLAEAIRGEQKTVRLNWLRVRMPKFQHTPVEQAALLAHLIGHDRIPERAKGQGLRGEGQVPEKSVGASPSLVPQPSPLADPQRVLAGRELLGGKGFSCVACHAVKDYTPKVTALGTRGSNLHLIGQRMRADYFFRWTRAPLRVMPGVEMPNYQRPHEFILPGQLDQQLTAVWEALNDPNLTAPTNPAVVEQLLTVQPGERPHIVRDVFTVPGGKDGETVARAFAAGFGNGHSVLFDLDTGSVRAWTLGDFARQRCEGKRWYWDLAGTVLATRFDPQPDILFVNNTTGDVLTPETGWQFHRKLTSHTEYGLSYRLTITRDMTSYSANFYEEWSETQPEGEEPLGWQRTIIVSDLKEAPLSPWFRGAIPAVLHEAASIVAEVNEQERPRGVPATARSFGGAPGGDAQLDPNSLGLTIRYTSSLKRVGVVSPNLLAPPLVSSADRITSVPGFRGQRLPLPRSIMPTAITFDDRQRPWFTSLKGQLYRIEPAAPGAEHLTLTTVTNGLAAPFGVLWQPGVKNPLSPPSERPTVLVAHKPELLRLHVADNDTVTLYDVLATGWGVSDDYHDWACGIARDSRGNLFLGLASDYTFKNRPKENSRWRGDILRINPKGEIESIARGLRYPTGLAIDEQDRLFVTDQQGVQNTFNELNYIQLGHRYGVPSRHEPEPNAPADPPAVQIPHPWTRSVNGIVFVPRQRPRDEGRGARDGNGAKNSSSSPLSPQPLAPLAGHFLAAEYNNNSIIRMSVQEVDGVVQGAVYPFSRPTSDEAPLSATPNSGGTPVLRDSSSFIGPICLGISPAGDIYVGGFQDGGWAGGLNMGDIVKLTPEGELPNGLREIRATPRGFDLEFFHPIDPKLAAQTSQYKISGYTRVWKGDYATSDSGRHTGDMRAATLSNDGRTVSLVVGGLKPGHVYDVSVGEIGMGDNRSLWPAIGHYTLHCIPQ